MSPQQFTDMVIGALQALASKPQIKYDVDLFILWIDETN